MCIFANDQTNYISAQVYLKAGDNFKKATGYGSGKAGEVLISSFVNAWLKSEGDLRCLQPQKINKGPDCIVHDGSGPLSGTNWVEIKTLKVGTPTAGGWFEFVHSFLPQHSKHVDSLGHTTLLNNNVSDFEKHIIVVFAYLQNAAIRTIYIAHGPDVMIELAELLFQDTLRKSFKISGGRKIDNPRINHAGLDALINKFPFSVTTDANWVKKLDKLDELGKPDPTFGNIENLLNGKLNPNTAPASAVSISPSIVYVASKGE